MDKFFTILIPTTTYYAVLILKSNIWLFSLRSNFIYIDEDEVLHLKKKYLLPHPFTYMFGLPSKFLKKSTVLETNISFPFS